MAAHSSLGTWRIAAADRIDNFGMFLHRGLDGLAIQHNRKVTPSSWYLHLLEDRQQIRISAEFRDEVMEPRIPFHVVTFVARAGPRPIAQLLFRRCSRKFSPAESLGSEPRGQPLEDLSHMEGVLEALARKWRNDRTTVGFNRNETVHLQSVQDFAYRAATDLKFLDKVRFDE